MDGVFEHSHVTHGGYRGKEGRQEQEHILPQHREGFADCVGYCPEGSLYIYIVLGRMCRAWQLNGAVVLI